MHQIFHMAGIWILLLHNQSPLNKGNMQSVNVQQAWGIQEQRRGQRTSDERVHLVQRLINRPMFQGKVLKTQQTVK